MTQEKSAQLGPFIPDVQPFGPALLSNVANETVPDRGRTTAASDGGTGQSDAGGDYTPAMLGVKFDNFSIRPFNPTTIHFSDN